MVKKDKCKFKERYDYGKAIFLLIVSGVLTGLLIKLLFLVAAPYEEIIGLASVNVVTGMYVTLFMFFFPALLVLASGIFFIVILVGAIFAAFGYDVGND